MAISHSFKWSIPTALALLLLFWWWMRADALEPLMLIEPEMGEFVVSVTASGELRAKNSTKIFGPRNAQIARMWNMKVSRLVEEGTVVKNGDFVAELDRSDLDARIQELQLNVQNKQSVVDQAMLDSTLNLSQARDQLDNLEFSLEDKRITMDQSKYESPAVQRQAAIDYERTLRQLEQEKKNYITKVKQAEARIREVNSELQREQNNLDKALELRQQFTILAPQEGMIVYAREWNGKKVTVGSQVSAFNPVVAELPDMRVMESVTYINEVDIKKIEEEQKVDVVMDAYPDKLFTGRVTKVANVGERRPNSDANVFEVIIEVNESDSTLRPSMSTRNTIIVERIPDALSIALEAIHSFNAKTFVYKREAGRTLRQEVRLGSVNDMSAEILAGIAEKDQVLLSVPEDTVNMLWSYLPEQLSNPVR